MIHEDHQRIGPTTLLIEAERHIPPAPITYTTLPSITRLDVEQAMANALIPVWQELQAMRRTLNILTGEQRESRILMNAMLAYQRRPTFWGKIWQRLTH